MNTQFATVDQSLPKRFSVLIIGLAFLALGFIIPTAQAQTYVDAAASAGAGSGTQADPFGDLQTALANTSSGEILVAAGRYYPDEGQGQTADDRNATFTLKNGVTIIGGFDASDWAGGSNPDANVTLLSGDITQDDTVSPITDPQTQIAGDNSIHVVTAEDVNATAGLDGVTITAGNADVSQGGSGNLLDDGGGLFIANGDGPTIRNVTIMGNRSVDDSGGLNVNNSQPTFINLRLRNNYTEGLGGGVSIDGNGSNVTFINVLVEANSADVEGGGIYVNQGTEFTLINGTLVGNVASNAGGGLFVNGNVTASNSIFWDNTAGGNANQINIDDALDGFNNLLEGGTAAVTGSGTSNFTGTLDADPQFADAANGDFRLQGPGSGGGASAAIDAGLNAALDLDGSGTQDVSEDINGNPRVQDATGTGTPTVDLGAFESDGSPLPVELIGFTARPDGASIQLAWSTVSETNNAGFQVQHRAPGSMRWAEVAFVEGAETTDRAQSYRHAVSNLEYGTHRFRLRQVDLDGSSTLSDPVTAELRLDASAALEVSPNPVRQQARVKMTVQDRQAVTVEVFDVLGRKVRTLHQGGLSASETRTMRLDTSGLSSGVYFVRMTGEQVAKTQRVTVVR